jgi:hypothetical protein
MGLIAPFGGSGRAVESRKALDTNASQVGRQTGAELNTHTAETGLSFSTEISKVLLRHNPADQFSWRLADVHIGRE